MIRYLAGIKSEVGLISYDENTIIYVCGHNVVI